MLHHKNPESNDSGFFAWAGQDSNREAVRFPACKIHSIGGVLSLAGVIYSAQFNKSELGGSIYVGRIRNQWRNCNHYAEISEMLKDHDHVIITNHGRGESVLINIEDYAKYEEFLHQRYVAEALAKAKQQAADPDTQWADHESVWETLGKQYDV